MEYFNLDMFVDYAKERYEDIGTSHASVCPWKIFLKSYLRDKSWLLNETIARPTSISSPVIYTSPEDSGGPSKELVWYGADIVYSQGLVRPGRSSNDLGWDLESSCVTRSATCKKSESLFSIDLTTGRFSEETVVLVQRHPSLETSNKSIEEYYTQLEEVGEEPFDDVETIPISKQSTVFSISETEMKDLRFKDRETRYQVESCIPFEDGSTYCIDVAVLNTIGLGVPEFDLGFGDSVIRDRDDDSIQCRLYRLCHFEVSPSSSFVSRILGPYDCSFEDIETSYPAVKNKVMFLEGEKL